MDSKDVVLSSLKESFLLVKKNKKAFLLVFILKILFFSLVIAVGAYYTPRILQSAQDAIDYAESLNINPDTANIGILQQKSPLGDDPLSISRNYNLIAKKMFYLLFYVFFFFLIINFFFLFVFYNISYFVLISVFNGL